MCSICVYVVCVYEPVCVLCVSMCAVDVHMWVEVREDLNYPSFSGSVLLVSGGRVPGWGACFLG